MAYIEMFIAPVVTSRREDYVAKAEAMAALFKDHGALGSLECWGSHVPDGEVTSYPLAVKLEEGETVVTGFVRWPSKEARDKGFEAAMADPRMQEHFADMPIDGKRMVFGGFDVIVET